MKILLLAALLPLVGCRGTTASEEQATMASPVVVTPAPVKDLAPTVGTPIVFTDVTASTVTVSWGAASDDATLPSELRYRVLRGADITDVKNPARVRVAQDWTAASTSLKVSGLAAGTAHYFMVLVKDAVGNTSYYDPKAVTPKAITKSPLPLDNDPPIPGSALSFSEVAAQAMTVTWGAATDTVTNAKELQYKLTCMPAGGDAAAVVGILAWTVNVTTKMLSELKTGTIYDCLVAVKDTSGNEALYAPAAQATPAAPPPPPPDPGISVTSPNGGESLERNVAQAITWTSTGIDGAALLEVAFSTDEGATWTTLATEQTVGSGSYAWTPTIPSSTYRVRVTVAENSAWTDQSDRSFSVAPASGD